MTASTNYAAARAATISAAEELYGVGSPEATTVAAAWAAVNVN
jgi:Zn-dependent metalloprotease